MTNISGVVVIDHHLDALAFVIAADEEPTADSPVGLHVDGDFEVLEFLVGEEDASVAAAGGILFSSDEAIFDLPDPTGSVPDLGGILVPAIESFAIENGNPRSIISDKG